MLIDGKEVCDALQAVINCSAIGGRCRLMHLKWDETWDLLDNSSFSDELLRNDERTDAARRPTGVGCRAQAFDPTVRPRFVVNPRVVASIVVVVWTVSSVGVRVLLHYRATGSSGLNLLKARPGSAEWIGVVLFVFSLVAIAVGAFMGPGGSAWSAMSVTGGLLGVAGVLLTFVAQSALGDSWRIGVDHTEQTTLRTGGLYAFVRNPIFSAMLMTAGGVVLLAPMPLTVVGLVGLVVSIEMQVRLVEEPYLARVHGPQFGDYMSNVGRFFPKPKR